MSKDGFIGLNSDQPDRQNAAPVNGVGVPVDERDSEWGAFGGVELIDGAGVEHLIEGRFMARNNNVTKVRHEWAGQAEDLTLGDPARIKLDEFNVNPFEGNIRILGHEYGTSATLRAMGSIKGNTILTGWTPRGTGEGGGISLPAYDASKPPMFSDVPAGSPFREGVETLAALGIISGYDLPGGGKEFRPNAGVTRGQIGKIGLGIIKKLLGR